MGQEQQPASLRAPGIQWLYCWGCERGCPAGNGLGLRGERQRHWNKRANKWQKMKQKSSKCSKARGTSGGTNLRIGIFSAKNQPLFIIHLRAFSLSSNEELLTIHKNFISSPSLSLALLLGRDLRKDNQCHRLGRLQKLHLAGTENRGERKDVTCDIKNDGVVKAVQKHPVSANCLWILI